MNYFIGDLHLFNRNQTGEGVNYDGRPFATVAEMNQYMLPKELFLSTLEKIQKQEARIDEFNTALSKICDGVPVFDSENQYLIALRELLKYTMQDQYDYIGWWLYEAPDAGYTVWWDDEDGKEIRVDLTEPGALYDYLVEYAAPEGVQEDEL